MSVVCTITGLWCPALGRVWLSKMGRDSRTCTDSTVVSQLNIEVMLTRPGSSVMQNKVTRTGAVYLYIYIYILITTHDGSSALLAPAAGDEDTVHRQHQGAGPHPPGPHHQQELPVHVLEGDLGPHPGLAVRAVLLYRHLARLASVGPRQHCQAALTSLCRDILLSLQGPETFREILTSNASHSQKPFH